MYFSKMKITTAKIRSQVCSARKPIACPAVLNRKLTIEPMSPGRSEPSLEPTSLRPLPIAFPVPFKALVIAPTTAPIVTPAARKITVNVTPYFLKISLTRSERGRTLSLSSTSVCSRASSSFLSATLASAASLSEGEAFSFWAIAWSSSFWRLSSLSCSFRSSRGFVLFRLSSIKFLSLSFSASFARSLSTFLCAFSLFFAIFSSAATSFFLFSRSFSAALTFVVLLHFQDCCRVLLQGRSSAQKFY